jgi:hypothetical protein
VLLVASILVVGSSRLSAPSSNDEFLGYGNRNPVSLLLPSHGRISILLGLEVWSLGLRGSVRSPRNWWLVVSVVIRHNSANAEAVLCASVDHSTVMCATERRASP